MATLRAAGASLALGMLLTLASCGGDPVGPGPSDSEASIRVSANVSGTPIDILVITVSAADIPVPPVFNLPVVEGVASGTVRVPPGTARTFSVTAYDAGGEITHDGAATRDVQRGQNPPLAIPLTPRSGQVPLTISFGDFSVIVAPAAVEIDLADPAIAFAQLTVTVTNAQGDVIASPDVAWATTDPSRAQVSQQGVVTGLLAGEVDIVATYNGIAGISHVTLIGALPTVFYPDFDGDGFGDPSGATEFPEGEDPPLGYIPVGGDCDDANPEAYPGAEEVFDGTDNDCDGFFDESVTLHIYPDSDGDGFGGNPPQDIQSGPDGSIDLPAGFTTQGGDCNDANAAIKPGASEVADGVDNDCDFLIDEQLYLADSDQDQYGSFEESFEFESDPGAGFILATTSLGFDCNDFDAGVHPGAVETVGDGLDSNCDSED